MKNKTLTILVIAGLIILLAIVFTRKPIVQAPDDVDNTPAPTLSGDVQNFVLLSIQPGETLTGTVTVTGQVKGAYFFEANARGSLLDTNKNSVKQFPIAATSDWMTAEPVSFTFTVDTTTAPKGPGFVRIANDNASGLPENDRFIDVPVIFQ